MAPVTVLAVGGTGESFPGDRRTEVSGLLRAVTDELDDRFVGHWVTYPASYGPVAVGGLSYRDSTEVGAASLAAEIDAVGGPVALIGYSQGCTVVREFLGRMANETLPAVDVVAAGFVSDPRQPAGAVPDCTGYGVAGHGPAVPDAIPVLWVGDPKDVICNASDDSLVRDIADVTRSMSLRATAVWMRSLWVLVRTNSFQNASKTRLRPRQWVADVRRMHTAAMELLGYLPKTLTWHGLRIRNPRGGRHTSYANEPLDGSGQTGCQMLAVWLAQQVPVAPSVAA